MEFGLESVDLTQFCHLLFPRVGVGGSYWVLSFTFTVLHLILIYKVLLNVEFSFPLMHYISAGKISRRVSLVHYPEPSEHNSINLKEMSQRSSAATSAMSGRHFVTTRSSQQKNSQTMSGYRSSAPSSKIKSSVSGPGEFLKPTKRRHVDEPRKSTGQSTQDSARGNSAVTSIGSLEHSDKRKPKKQKKKWGLKVLDAQVVIKYFLTLDIGYSVFIFIVCYGSLH